MRIPVNPVGCSGAMWTTFFSALQEDSFEELMK